MTVVVFVLFFLIPADPTSFIVRGQSTSEYQRDLAREQLGLDAPAHVVYARWLWRMAHADFGISFSTLGPNVPPEDRIHVGERLVQASAVTGSLALGGLVLLIAIAVPLGVLAARRPNSFLDRTSTIGAIAVIALPPVVVGLLLQTFVANHWGLLPSGGYCPLVGTRAIRAPLSQETVAQCGGPVDWAQHLVLPWLAFALFFVALYMRMVRSRMLDVLEEPYVRTARAKGAGEVRTVVGHAFRNALVPLVTMAGMDLGLALGVAVYVETIFGLPGLGRQMLFALPQGDFGVDLPLVSGLVVVTTTAIIGLNLLVDLLYSVLDPRVGPTASRGGAALVAAERVS
jgi:peptide/nickel transport system permease protein